MLNDSQEPRFDREVDDSGYETIRIGLDLFTELLNGVSGILALALWLQISREGVWTLVVIVGHGQVACRPRYRESTSIISDRATNQWDQSNLLDISER